jgi:DNA-binding MarR family transcriptional regulator
MSDVELRRELNEQLLVLVGRVRQHLKEQAAEAGLSVLQSRVLGYLNHASSSARELAERLELDPSNITGVVDRLEEAGLLRREPQPGDRRVKLLVLTDEGRTLAQAVRRRAGEHNPFVDALSPDRQRELSELLTAMLREPALP